MLRNELLTAIAYGDAAGLPVETKTAQEIAGKYGRIGRLLPPDDHADFSGEPAGTWSDDTQLSLGVAGSLIDAEGFDLANQAEYLVEAYHLTPLGWGGATRDSAQRIIAGTHPSRSGDTRSLGNGALMKLAPLAYWHFTEDVADVVRYQELDALTRMTHDSDLEAACSRVYGDMLEYCLDQTDRLDFGVFAAYAVASAVHHSRVFRLKGHVLKEPLTYLGETRPTPARILDRTDGKGFFAPQTLAMAFGAFMSADTFEDRVYNAVNLGGDTDSIASITAVLSVCHDASATIPADSRLLRHEAELSEVSRELVIAAVT
jgi:ADP-ribosyl-[dinitrogen reductase] hydrolase